MEVLEVLIAKTHGIVEWETPSGFAEYAAEGFLGDGIEKADGRYVMSKDQFEWWRKTAENLDAFETRVEGLKDDLDGEYFLLRMVEDRIEDEIDGDMLDYEDVHDGAFSANNVLDEIEEMIEEMREVLDSPTVGALKSLLSDHPDALEAIVSHASGRLCAEEDSPIMENPGTLRILLEKYGEQFGALGLRGLLFRGDHEVRPAHALAREPELASVMLDVCRRMGIDPSEVVSAVDGRGRSVAEYVAGGGGEEALKALRAACESFGLSSSAERALRDACRMFGFDVADALETEEPDCEEMRGCELSLGL